MKTAFLAFAGLAAVGMGLVGMVSGLQARRELARLDRMQARPGGLPGGVAESPDLVSARFHTGGRGEVPQLGGTPVSLAELDQAIEDLRKSNEEIRAALAKEGILGGERYEAERFRTQASAAARDKTFPAVVALEQPPLGTERVLLVLDVAVRKLGLTDETSEYEVLFRFAEIEQASMGRLRPFEYEGDTFYLLETADLAAAGKVYRCKIRDIGQKEDAAWWASRLKPVGLRTEERTGLVYKRISFPARAFSEAGGHSGTKYDTVDHPESIDFGVCWIEDGQLVIGAADYASAAMGELRGVFRGAREPAMEGGKSGMALPDGHDVAKMLIRFVSESDVPNLRSVGEPITPVEAEFAE